MDELKGYIDNCTGAMEKDGEALAFYRVLKPNGKRVFAIPMDANQISERRIYLRKTLASYPRWENLRNEELEDIRCYSVQGGHIVEDAAGCQFFLASKSVSMQECDFRKARALIPFEFMNVTAKDFNWNKYKADVTEPKGMVNKYIMHYTQFKEQGMGLYIHSGTKGSGKTMLACCMINEITKRHPGSVKFVNILDFLEMTKKSYDGNNEVEAIYQAGLLVLDDIGVQMSKEWTDTVLYHLINERYANRLPTIYTSNIPIALLKMDDRIIDRIESMSYTVCLPEESIRRATMQQSKQAFLDKIKTPSSVTSTGQGRN